MQSCARRPRAGAEKGYDPDVVLLRRLAIACVVLVPFGCNLLLDVGEHVPEDAPDAGLAASASSGGAGASGGAAAPGGAGGGGGGGGADAGSGASAGGPVVLARGQQRPWRLTLDSDYVYWINEPTPKQPSGSVNRVRKDGSKRAEVIHSGDGHPMGLRLSTASVFYTNDININGDDVGLFKVPKVGGEERVKIDDDGLGAGVLAARGSFLYSEAWAPAVPARVRRTSASANGTSAGCYPYTSAVSGGRIPDLVAADDDYLYVIDPEVDAIMRSATDCDSVPEIFAQGWGGAVALTFGSTHVSWVTTDSVARLAKTDPAGEVSVLADGLPTLAGIDVRSSLLVVTCPGDGTVRSVDMAGKDPPTEVLASGQGGPHDVRIDMNKSIFWTNYDSGEVMRLDIE